MGISSSTLDMNKPIIWELTGEFVDKDYKPVKLKKNEILKFWKKVLRVHKKIIFDISNHKVSKVIVKLGSKNRVRVTLNYKKSNDNNFTDNELNKIFSSNLKEILVQTSIDDFTVLRNRNGKKIKKGVMLDNTKNFKSKISQ